MPSVLLGNISAKEPVLGLTVNEDPETTPVEGKTILQVTTPDCDEADQPISLDKQLGELRFAFSLHSDGQPSWVECGDDFFAKAAARSFGCPVGRPDDWDAQDDKPGVAKVAAVELIIEDTMQAGDDTCE